MVIASHYAFYISLENTLLDDYVTEKFYQGFLADTVMVRSVRLTRHAR